MVVLILFFSLAHCSWTQDVLPGRDSIRGSVKPFFGLSRVWEFISLNPLWCFLSLSFILSHFFTFIVGLISVKLTKEYHRGQSIVIRSFHIWKNAPPPTPPSALDMKSPPSGWPSLSYIHWIFLSIQTSRLYSRWWDADRDFGIWLRGTIQLAQC